MNKIQYIKLLNLRGYDEMPQGESIASLVRVSGGEPSPEEMVLVNESSMTYYIEKYTEQKTLNKELMKEVTRLGKRNDILLVLEGAGVDNWEGYDYAMETIEI